MAKKDEGFYFQDFSFRDLITRDHPGVDGASPVSIILSWFFK